MNATDERGVAACDFCHLPVAGANTSDGPLYCCYGCQLAADITRARGEAGQLNWMLTRMGLSVFLSMTVMMFSMYLYRQHGLSAEDVTPLSLQLASVMRYLCLLFSVPVFFMLGWPILVMAMEGARRGVYSTDALVVLGVAASFVYSYVSTLRDSGAVYFETGCVVLVFMTLGRWLEANGKLKASKAVASLEGLYPERVTIVRDDGEQEVAPGEVCEGDVLIVHAGQRIAADGEIVHGRAHIDESMLTGESVPIVKEVGAIVRAGTLNVDGSLRIRATSVGTHSTIGRMVALLEEAKRSKGAWERLTDRIATAFVPLTLMLAATGFALGARRGGIDGGLMSAMAVLLIACPCALGIATPMAVWVSLGRAARKGILFRGGDVIETLAAARAICFDKTGTLSTGEATVTAFHAAEGVTTSNALQTARRLAAGSNHVLSRAIAEYASSRHHTEGPALEVRVVPGRGIMATANAEPVMLGNPAMMEENGCVMDAHLTDAVARIHKAGSPLACIGWAGAVRGVFEFAERLRPEARASMNALRHIGLSPVVVTGDHEGRAAAISQLLDVEAHGALRPGDKVEKIKERRRASSAVVMVGDGINDAPALAAADVGIAMGCGADITRESGGVCLLGENLLGVPWAISLARRTVRTIKVNLFWAFAYNVVGIGLALSGRLNPIFAAFAMLASSVMVIANSLRLGRGDRDEMAGAEDVRAGKFLVEATT
ncbi:MAG: cation-translocating P-type ATPase [Planctomycetes bacterium]|nr:cation-translocating P-type ATPase [Planctomycetota bacterium]